VPIDLAPASRNEWLESSSFYLHLHWMLRVKVQVTCSMRRALPMLAHFLIHFQTYLVLDGFCPLGFVMLAFCFDSYEQTSWISNTEYILVPIDLAPASRNEWLESSSFYLHLHWLLQVKVQVTCSMRWTLPMLAYFQTYLVLDHFYPSRLAFCSEQYSACANKVSCYLAGTTCGGMLLFWVLLCIA